MSLADHPDRLRWNDRYGPGFDAPFTPHPLAERALSLGLPDGPVADLACGPSGSALLAAASGRQVTAVDISDVALALLDREARRRGLARLISVTQADLGTLHLPPRHYALVLSTGYWDRVVFARAAEAVAPGGLIGWEAFTVAALTARPGLRADWCLAPGEPVSLLPAGFTVVEARDLPENGRGTKRRLLARREAAPGPVRETGMVSANEHAGPQDEAQAPAVQVDDLDLPFFDYNEPGLVGEVYHARLASVREQGWLARSPLALVVLDHSSGEFFLRAKQTAFPGREIADLFGVTGGRLREQIDANILNQTGERHRRLRALVGPAFTPRAAAHWRPAMRGFAEQLWRDMASAGAGAERGGGTSRAGECDFVAAFAKPYPSLTIAAVLGAPLADAPRLHEWSTWVQRQFDIRALGSEPERIERATSELYDYVEALLELRRREPSDDLISALLAAEEEGQKLSHDECINLVLNVIAGGVDTTQAQLSHAMRLFAAHPRQWDLLAREPERVPAAVAEVLRYEPITPFTARICTAQIEHRGVIFPAGSIVAICAERANREQDGGEEFDITADRDGRALTFGAGPHFCLGSNLARAELEEAVTFLALRMTGLRPAAPAQLGGVEGIYGIESLPLAWSPA